MKTMGKTAWAIASGHIPLISTGKEPENTSRDELCFLNAGFKEAHVEVTLFYSDRDPVGPYQLAVPARRVRRVRINDLINPEAPPLDTDYGAIVESDLPIVVQLDRKDTSRSENSILTTMGFPLQ
jgi:hypothetical protein